MNQQLKESEQSIIHSNSEYLVSYIEMNPHNNFDNLLVEAVTYNKFNLADIILELTNTTPLNTLWSDFMVSSATNNNLDLTKYCINQGATNFAECFYCAKNYESANVANYLIYQMNKDEQDINKVNKLFINKQHKQIYEFFGSK
jgi:hypothetical protein